MPKRFVRAIHRIHHKSVVPPDVAGSHPQSGDAELAQINLNFLFLLRDITRQSSRRWQPQFGMPTPLNQLISQLDLPRIERLANCGLALFDAHFHNQQMWQHIFDQSNCTAPDQRGAAVLPSTQTSLQRICVALFDSILFYVWHRVQQQPQRSVEQFGMHPMTNALISQLTIWQCQYVACQHSGLLTVRWRQHAYFWADLLHFAYSGDPQFLRLARTIATQQQVRQLTPQSLARLTRPCYTNAE